jgi:cystathionine beta-lyase/cystathionine gamma-synthase
VVYTSFLPTGPEKILASIRPNTTMLWVEMPSNPLLKVTDHVGQT